MTRGLEIFYDGDCPFCGAYTRMLVLKRSVGRVEVIDARSGDPRLQELAAAGLDLDEGIVVRHGGLLWHGAEAMQLLAILSQRRSLLQTVMRSPHRAALLYPVLKAGRRLTLMVLRRKELR